MLNKTLPAWPLFSSLGFQRFKEKENNKNCLQSGLFDCWSQRFVAFFST